MDHPTVPAAAPMQRIRARVHESAVSRVTRMYAASLGDALTETFQNARRAGATRVLVAVHGVAERLTITVSDDGAGIADPALLLSFGENGWSDALVAREDAAGMGLLSLARRGCTVLSRIRAPDPTAAPAWRLTLTPEHFLGEADAEVHPDIGAPWPHGTAVTFPAGAEAQPGTIRHVVEAAARHFPLPVTLDYEPHTVRGGEPLERRAFLDGALHVERWRGLVFGVFRDRWNGIGLNDPDVNFHGHTVSVRLPSTEAVHGPRWTIAADIVDCPELELVLPARNEAVQTPFLDEMREAARLAIYRAMAADPDPRPPFEDWKRAAAAGIDIAPAPAELRPWRPETADADDWHEPPKLAPIGPDAIVMDFECEPPAAQALWRAAHRAGIADRLFEPDRRLEGYGHYDAIDRAFDMHTEIFLDGNRYALDDYPATAPRALPRRPGAIRISLAIAPHQGNPHFFGLPADVAFAGEDWCWVADTRPLVTSESTVEPWALAELLRAAYFSASDDAGADSWERQRDEFLNEALHLATRLLVSDDAARRASIADAVAREVFWFIPDGRDVDISVRNRRVTVTFIEPAPVPAQ